MPSVQQIADCIANDPNRFLDEWLQRFSTEPMRVPGSKKDALLRASLWPVVDALAISLSDHAGRELPMARAPGSAHFKELEKGVAFLGAKFAALGFRGFDLYALFSSLRATTEFSVPQGNIDKVAPYLEWLCAIAFDSMVRAVREGAEETYQDELEASSPMFLIPGEIPLLTLRGRPSCFVLENLFGRLVMMGVRTGCSAALIHCEGYQGDKELLLTHLAKYARHPRVSVKVQLVLVGPPWLSALLNDTSGIGHLEVQPRMDRAMERVYEHSRLRLIQRT